MEQCNTAGKDHQRTIAEKAAQACRWIAGMRSGFAAVRAHRIDLTPAHHLEGNERRHAKSGGDKKNRLVREQVARRSHSRSGDGGTCGSEAGVAAKSLGDRLMTDETEADGANRRTEHATRKGVQHLGGEHGEKDWPHSDDDSTKGNSENAKSGHDPFRTGGVENR